MTEFKSTQHKRDANGRVIQNNMEKKKRKSTFASVGISVLVLSTLLLGGLTYLTTSQNNRYSAIVDNQNRHIKMVETELREKNALLESANTEIKYPGDVITIPNPVEPQNVSTIQSPTKTKEVYPSGESQNKPEEILSTDQE